MKQAKQNNKKVVVLGLDGADMGIINSLVEKGEAPNFAKLIRQGAFGLLESVIPPITPCAWSSFATGCEPSKHGIVDFCTYDKNYGRKEFVNNTFLQAKSLWDILNKHNKKSVLINIPIISPKKVNGIVVCDNNLVGAKTFTYPAYLHAKFKKLRFIDYAMPKQQGSRKKKQSLIVRRLCEKIKNTTNMISWILKNKDWDFLMAVFMEADRACHSCFEHEKKIETIYKKLDKAVGDIFKNLDNNVIKIIVSDHGFVRTSFTFRLNEWLFQKGLLCKEAFFGPKTNEKKLLKDIKNQAAGKMKKEQPCIINLRADKTKSKAFLLTNYDYGIRINKNIRNDFFKNDEALKNYIVKELKKVKHPETGKRVFKHVWINKAVFKNKSLQMPDICFLPDNNIRIINPMCFPFNIYGKALKSWGFHNINGIFFAQGAGIRKARLNNIKITDIAPTILHIFGIPVPANVDGRYLNVVFQKSSPIFKRKMQIKEYAAVKNMPAAYSQKEKNLIENRLKQLGYIG